MINTYTKQPIQFSGGFLHSMMVIPQTQIKAVTDLLDAHGIPYLVDQEVKSIPDGLVFGAVYLDRGKDFDRAQRLLAEAP